MVKKKVGKESQGSDDRKKKLLEAIARLRAECQDDQEHTGQVTRLALTLFDELKRLKLNRYGADARSLLEYAGMLHDIGWVEGGKGHHKASLKLIMDSKELPLTLQRRRIIGSIARYHRGKQPSEKHPHYAALSAVDQKLVCLLGGMLRVADALDHSHRQRVLDLTCEVGPKELILRPRTTEPAEEERLEALDKRDLLEQTLARKLDIQWQQS